MSSPRKKLVYRRLYIGYAIGALVLYLLLMVFVMPWWHASNQPVKVTLGAGSATQVFLEYSVDEQPLPLVPIGEPAGYHWQWGTELPPRPSYNLVLSFPEGSIGDVVLKEFEVVRLMPDKESAFANLEGLSSEGAEGIRLKETTSGIRIYSEPGGRLPIPLEVAHPSPYLWLISWAKATTGFVIVSLVLLFTLSTFLQFPDRIQAYRKRVPAWESLLLLIFVVCGAMTHLHLVRNSMPNFTPGESENYIRQAIDAEAEGLVIPDAHYPGYPALLAYAGARLDWDMSEVTMIQASLFCAVLALLGFSMVRLVHAYALGPVLLLAYASPPALWASLHIGVESLQASCWILTLSSFLYLWKREGWQRWLGWIVFSFSLILAASISPSGLLLLVLPIGLIFGTLIWAIVVRGKHFYRLRVLWSTLGQVLIPITVLLVTCWLFGPEPAHRSSMPGSEASAPFSCGMFEIRALEGTPDYTAIINERVENGYRFDGPEMLGYPGLAAASREALPLRALLVAWGRVFGWGIFLPEAKIYSGESLLTDYRLRHGFKSRANAEAVQESITNIMRETGQFINLREKRSNRQVVVYNSTVLGVYAWFYRVLLFCGLAGWAIGLADRKFLAVALALPFTLNILLNSYMLNMSSHSIQSMDACLWLGALVGLLCVNAKALQKPTDETDRRSLKPIRPKRLFTRHETLPGMPQA